MTHGKSITFLHPFCVDGHLTPTLDLPLSPYRWAQANRLANDALAFSPP
ncbi:protein of unknown function (plasmid) [Rhodovastum atsumiense]|nr:protein of unknown function [Rhodovastum atsumiense]